MSVCPRLAQSSTYAFGVAAGALPLTREKQSPKPHEGIAECCIGVICSPCTQRFLCWYEIDRE